MPARRGIGLGSTLIVAALVATLALALAGLAISHLNLSARLGNSSAALDLARSTAALAIARIKDKEDFAGTLQIEFGSDRSQGVLSFDSTRASELGIPVSVNNLAGEGSRVAPDGTVVPLHAVYLAAEGRSRGVRRLVRTVLHVPAFPYAAACDGVIASNGELLVGSVSPGEETLDLDKLKPADLRSNESIHLGASSKVLGDAIASREIEVGTSQVLGMVRPDEPPEKLPKMNLSSFDPATGGKIDGELWRVTLRSEGGYYYGEMFGTANYFGSGVDLARMDSIHIEHLTTDELMHKLDVCFRSATVQTPNGQSNFYDQFSRMLQPLPGSTTTTTTGQSSLFTVDPTKFISLADSMRIALWDER